MSIKSTLMDLLFPVKCCLCHQLAGQMICEQCQSELLEPYNRTVELQFAEIESLTVLYNYNEKLKHLLWLVKYDNRADLLNFIDNAFLKFKSEAVDLIIPVPIHPERYRQRGFNQVSLIFGKWAACNLLQLNEELVYRSKATSKLAEKSRQQREVELKNCFKVFERNKKEIYSKKILLLDDILTTGFTVRELAVVLKKAGAAEVHLLALSRSKN